MALTLKGTATRQRIIEGAAMHLRSDAPGEVTLDEIRSITGTSKRQIFHYFPSGKDELLLAVAQYEADRVLSDQQPHLETLNSWAAWRRWRDAVVSRYELMGSSCPLGALMAQLSTTPGSAEVIAVLLENWQADIRQASSGCRVRDVCVNRWIVSELPRRSSPAFKAESRCCAPPEASRR
jgi:AcrR family transcriptional regulator